MGCIKVFARRQRLWQRRRSSDPIARLFLRNRQAKIIIVFHENNYLHTSYLKSGKKDIFGHVLIYMVSRIKLKDTGPKCVKAAESLYISKKNGGNV